MNALDGVVAELLASPRDGHVPPGAALLVAAGGRTFAGAAGIADLDSAEPMTLAHRHDLASVSKSLTTLALLVLIRRGLLAPESTLAALLGRERAGVHGDRTIEQLLRHRAGLAEWHPLYLAPGGVDDPLGVALALPPRYPADEGRHYSDLGFMALGGVLAAVTGMDLVPAIRALLLEPVDATGVGAGPVAGPVAAGPDGDAIEREMVMSGVPYPVDADPDAFDGWRRGTLRGGIADGNAFHAFRGAAGHAGWFAGPAGLLAIGLAIAEPERHGLWGADESTLLASAGPDEAQAFGLRRYRATWAGESREFLGHPGFAGSMLAASPAARPGEEPVVVVLASNRLHGRPAPGRGGLADVERMWRDALALADRHLNAFTTQNPGGRA